MQPNNQNGYWQPSQDQPVQPSAPPPPVGQSLQPIPQAPVEQSIPPVQQQYTAAPQPVAPPPQVQQPVPVQPVEYTPQPQPELQPVQPAQTFEQPQYATEPQPVMAQDQVVTDDQQEYYDDDQTEEFESDELSDEETVNWQATEYIHREKGVQWFIIFGIVLVAALAASVLLMRSITFTLLLVVVAVAIIIFAKRPPRVLGYSLSSKGLHIGDTLHNFADFKSFGVVHDGDEFSVMLIPTKRFQPGVSVYFPEESGEAIVDMLGSRLPMQDLKLDAVDKLTRFLRL